MKYARQHKKQQEASASHAALRVLFWGNRCFIAGTRVAVADGSYLPIEQVSPGMSVVSFDGDIAQSKRIIAVHKIGIDRYPKPLIEWEVNGKKITSTYDHEYYSDGRYIPVYQLAWGAMEERERTQLKLLCEQYGARFDDPSVWPSSLGSDEARTRPFWVLANGDEWQDGKDTSVGGGSMDRESAEQADGEPYRQRSEEQSRRELGVGDTKREPPALNPAWETTASGRGEVLQAYSESRGREVHARMSGERAGLEGAADSTGTSEALFASNSGDNPWHFERQELEVSSVRVLPPATVYDLTVEDNHNYVVEGLLVHNCGKSEWGGMEAAKVVLGEHPFIPPGDGWVFCPSFDEQKDTTQEKLLRYIPEHRIVDRTWLRKGILKEIMVRTGESVYKITFKSYEQGREKAQGAGKAFVWFDEEPPKDIFEECSVRVAAGQPLYMWMTMTPIKGMTWVYQDLYLNTANKDLFVSTATWDDNPFLTEEQKAKMAGRLTGNALKVRKEGKFMRQVGLVASWFDRSVHVMDFEEVPHGDIYMGIDFGFANPAACLWVSIDANENVWVYDGFYGTGMTNPVILDLIRQKEAATGLEGRIDRIGDSAQASDIKEMNDAGLRITGVEKQSGTDTENWDEWRAKLMEDLGRITDEQPHPRIIISSQLVAYDDEGNPYNFLMRELENLRWEEVKYDGVVQPKSVWGRQANHAIDALTYILATVERNRRRGTGRVLRTQTGRGIITSDEPHSAQRIIDALKKSNQRPVNVWQDES